MNTEEKPMYEWNALNWKKIQRNVFKLQKRIYQASLRGDIKSIRKLQKLLLKSHAAKLLAVRKVTQDNQGKNTAGIDGVSKLSPSQRLVLCQQLSLNAKVKPTRRVWIPKPNSDEKRPLGIPVMKDRALQALVKLSLEPEWEAKFEPNSYGFRPGRSAHDAIEAIFLSVRNVPKYVLDADIEKCFDRINHQELLKRLNTYPSLTRLIRAWLKAGVMENEVFSPTESGTPQGGVIALRTHSQTLSFAEGLKLNEGNFNYVIKSITFMTNGKSTELGIGQTHQPGVYLVAKQQAPAAYSRKTDAEVWGVSGTGLPLYTVSQGDQRKNGDTGKFCGVYCKTATYTDQADKEIIGIQRAIDQQSGSYCAGRIFSKEGSWQKRSNNLRYHLPMIVCGSKSSLRFTISLFRTIPANLLFSLNNHRMN